MIPFIAGKAAARLFLELQAMNAEGIAAGVHDTCVAMGVPPPQSHMNSSLQLLHLLTATIMKAAEPDPEATRAKIVNLHGVPLGSGEMPGG